MKDTIELYKKIYIHSESVLPKESGYYYASTKEFKPRENQLWNRCYEKGHNDNWWLTEVDWYLQPLQSEEQPKEKKEPKEYTLKQQQEEFDRCRTIGEPEQYQPKAEAKGEEEWFDNHFDCYTDEAIKQKLVPALTKEMFLNYVASQPLSSDTLRNYILEIDALTTTEFCKKFNIPEPVFTGEVQSSARQFLQIDAIKHKMFVEKAKSITK